MIPIYTKAQFAAQKRVTSVLGIGPRIVQDRNHISTMGIEEPSQMRYGHLGCVTQGTNFGHTFTRHDACPPHLTWCT